MEGRWERWAPVSGLVFAVSFGAAVTATATSLVAPRHGGFPARFAWVLLANGLQLAQLGSTSIGTSGTGMQGEPL